MYEYQAQKTLEVIPSIFKLYENMDNIGKQKWSDFAKWRKEAKKKKKKLKLCYLMYVPDVK